MENLRIRPSEALRRHRDTILILADQFGLHNVRVFGSVVRGEDRDSSDLDLLVDPTPDVTTFFELADFKEAVQERLGVDVDVSTLGDIHPKFRAHVAAEARPL